jgi:hypothetical protein
LLEPFARPSADCRIRALFLAVVVAVAAPRYATGPVRIVIDATLVAAFDNRDPSKVRFGNLEFRGGLALKSKHPAFGGISGIHVEPGTMPGIADQMF